MIEALLTVGTRGAAQHALPAPKLVSGKWTGTMNLTEPQAELRPGAGAPRARCRRADGSLPPARAQKIFITYGEHDMAENIVHLRAGAHARRAARA